LILLIFYFGWICFSTLFTRRVNLGVSFSSFSVLAFLTTNYLDSIRNLFLFPRSDRYSFWLLTVRRPEHPDAGGAHGIDLADTVAGILALRGAEKWKAPASQKRTPMPPGMIN
jgi:hypothetical protein